MSFNQLPPSSENHMQRDIDSRATGVTIKKTPKNGSKVYIYTHTHRHLGDFYLSRKTSDTSKIYFFVSFTLKIMLKTKLKYIISNILLKICFQYGTISQIIFHIKYIFEK